MRKSWYNWQNDFLQIRVLVQTRAKHDEIVGLHDNSVRIRIKAAAMDGKANVELIRFIARVFDVPKSHIEIVRGTLSPRKTLVITAPQQIPLNLAHKLHFPPG